MDSETKEYPLDLEKLIKRSIRINLVSPLSNVLKTYRAEKNRKNINKELNIKVNPAFGSTAYSFYRKKDFPNIYNEILGRSEGANIEIEEMLFLLSPEPAAAGIFFKKYPGAEIFFFFFFLDFLPGSLTLPFTVILVRTPFLTGARMNPERIPPESPAKKARAAIRKTTDFFIIITPYI